MSWRAQPRVEPSLNKQIITAKKCPRTLAYLDEPSLETVMVYSGYISLAQTREYHRSSISTLTIVTNPAVTVRGI